MRTSTQHNQAITVRRLPAKLPPPSFSTAAPEPPSEKSEDAFDWRAKSHHNPQGGFHNPWPSFRQATNNPLNLLKMRFGNDRPPFAEVPKDREKGGLVRVRMPYWLEQDQHDGVVREGVKGKSDDHGSGFKVTWLGHAGFLFESSCPSTGITASNQATATSQSQSSGTSHHQARPIRILADAVFSDRTSPVTFLGPKRYTPPPCQISDLLEIDVVITSHDHYDHLDIHTVKGIYERAVREGRKTYFIAGLGTKSWYEGLGVPADWVVEVDWWDGVEVELSMTGSVDAETKAEVANGGPAKTKMRIWCTPSQHFSGRSPFNRNGTLWCSYYIEDLSGTSSNDDDANPTTKIFFAGDTGYRSVPDDTPDYESHLVPSTMPTPSSVEAKTPVCPGPSAITITHGAPHLSLLPIGLCNPRKFMAPVHCNPFDSLDIHKVLGAARSVGMHWGTVRGGLSGAFEDVRWPPRVWEGEGERRGLRVRGMNGSAMREGESNGDSDWDIGLMDVGETLVVDW